MQRLEECVQKAAGPMEVEAWYRIACLGDFFAEQNGWVFNGWSAVILVLVKRHNWLPEEIERMSVSHLAIVLTEDLVNHKLTPLQSSFLAQWMKRQQR
jgi:hypothetical protein